MKTIINIFKWITVALLFSSIAFFFMPYKDNYTILSAYEMASHFDGVSSRVTFEILIPLLIPTVFLIASAILMIFKINIPRSVISAVLCAIAVFFYGNYSTVYENPGLAITANLVISILGIILPIVLLILSKTAKQPAKSE